MFGRAPSITSITRTPIAVAPDPVEMTSTLAKEAAQLLGYHNLQRTIDSRTTTHAAMKELAAVFHKLGIEPLDRVKVNLYKAKQHKYTDEHKSGKVEWVLRPLKHEYNQYDHLTGSMESYDAPIPAFVLERAVQLKRELPEASFYVDSLEVSRVPADPFLMMHYKGVSTYIDVWDEPTFEGRRVV